MPFEVTADPKRVAAFVEALTTTVWPTQVPEVASYFASVSCEVGPGKWNDQQTLLVGDWRSSELDLSGSWMASSDGGRIALSFFATEAISRQGASPLLYLHLIEEFSLLWGSPDQFDNDAASPRASWERKGLHISLDCHGRNIDPPLIQLTVEPAPGR